MAVCARVCERVRRGASARARVCVCVRVRVRVRVRVCVCVVVVGGGDRVPCHSFFGRLAAGHSCCLSVRRLLVIMLAVCAYARARVCVCARAGACGWPLPRARDVVGGVQGASCPCPCHAVPASLRPCVVWRASVTLVEGVRRAVRYWVTFVFRLGGGTRARRHAGAGLMSL